MVRVLLLTHRIEPRCKSQRCVLGDEMYLGVPTLASIFSSLLWFRKETSKAQYLIQALIKPTKPTKQTKTIEIGDGSRCRGTYMQAWYLKSRLLTPT